MTTPMYGQGAGDRPPQIRFDAIGEAWNLLRANMGTWVLITLVYLVVVYAIVIVVTLLLSLLGLGTSVPGIGAGRHSSSADTVGMGAMIFGQGVSNILVYAVSAFFTGGFFRAALKQVRNETVSIGDLFSCGDVLGALAGGLILQILAMELGFVLCIVPGIFLMGALMFTVPLIVDKRMGAIEALKTSYETLKSQAWAAFGFYFCASLLSSLGGLLCGVGILVTAPIMYIAIAIVYRDFFGGGSFGPQIEMPFPPQQGYAPGMMPGMQTPPPQAPPQGPTPGSFDV